MYRIRDPYLQSIKNISKKFSTSLKLINEKEFIEDTMFIDHCHPLPVGQDLIAEKILNTFDILKHIDTVVGGDTFPGIRKPDGRHLSAVLKCLNVSPDHAVMVGDNHNDASAAQELGIPFIVVTFGYAHCPVEALGADGIIEHFDELLPVLDRLATATFK